MVPHASIGRRAMTTSVEPRFVSPEYVGKLADENRRLRAELAQAQERLKVADEMLGQVERTWDEVEGKLADLLIPDRVRDLGERWDHPSQIVDEVASLTAERDKDKRWNQLLHTALDEYSVQIATLTAERDKLLERIGRAMERSGGRWSEWGDRAVAVAMILDGEDPDEEDSDGR